MNDEEAKRDCFQVKLNNDEGLLHLTYESNGNVSKTFKFKNNEQIQMINYINFQMVPSYLVINELMVALNCLDEFTLNFFSKLMKYMQKYNEMISILLSYRNKYLMIIPKYNQELTTVKYYLTNLNFENELTKIMLNPTAVDENMEESVNNLTDLYENVKEQRKQELRSNFVNKQNLESITVRLVLGEFRMRRLKMNSNEISKLQKILVHSINFKFRNQINNNKLINIRMIQDSLNELINVLV